ncbi:hypothetical protein IPJ72_01560 [Candidatus Peregrinibacteria bacterium]|nr:MAG: hypothetical protein IPJ72_01560 [Candidatus Peregrinibacteria bacterium]
MTHALPVSFTNRKLIHRIRTLIQPYKARFYAGMALRISTDLAGLYPAYALASVINQITKDHSATTMNAIGKIMALWLLASVFQYSGRALAKYLVYNVAEKAAREGELATLKHLFKLDIAWHEKEMSGKKWGVFKMEQTALIIFCEFWLITCPK